MKKNYSKPSFELVRQAESNKVFFAGSGPAPSFGGSLLSMGSSVGQW